jgi:hypothetical protein
LADGVGRKYVVIAGGDQSGDARPALHEGTQVLFAPDIVHDEEDAPVAESLA